MISDTNKLFFKEKKYLILDNFISESLCDDAKDTIKKYIEKDKYFYRITENYMNYLELYKTPALCNPLKAMCITP